MEYNIVTNYKIVMEIKKSKYFIISLGYVSTEKKGDATVYRETDKFQLFYNKRYNTTIYGQGILCSDISIYTDHYIKDDQLAIYYDFEEFVFNFDWDILNRKGIDFLIGSYLKDIEFQRGNANNNITQAEVSIGNPYKLVPGNVQYNPGSITFDDIKAYKEAKRLGKI
jgi:hypothetical protein